MLVEYQKIDLPFKYDSTSRNYLEEFLSPELNYLKDLKWIATEKYDGMNIRVYFDGYKVSFYGRTKNAELPKEVESLLNETFKDAEIIFEQNFGNKEVILFMECYGGKVQGSKGRKWYNGIDESLMGFDVMIEGKYLDRKDIKNIFDLFNIPSVELKVYDSLIDIMNEVRDKTVTQTSYFEGYVATPFVPLLDRRGNRIITKIKCDMYRKILGLEKGINKTKTVKEVKERKKPLQRHYFVDQEFFTLSAFRDIEIVSKDKIKEKLLSITKDNFDEIAVNDVIIFKLSGARNASPYIVTEIKGDEITIKKLN